jgi:hypothetical protein
MDSRALGCRIGVLRCAHWREFGTPLLSHGREVGEALLAIHLRPRVKIRTWGGVVWAIDLTVDGYDWILAFQCGLGLLAVDLGS